jgi:hypothetical protein
MNEEEAFLHVIKNVIYVSYDINHTPSRYSREEIEKREQYIQSIQICSLHRCSLPVVQEAPVMMILNQAT